MSIGAMTMMKEELFDNNLYRLLGNTFMSNGFAYSLETSQDVVKL